jgi:hypothetical protein
MDEKQIFLERLGQLDLFDVINYCNTQVKSAEWKLKKAKKDESHQAQQYYQFVNNTYMYFAEGFRAPGFKDEDFMSLRPYVERLVELNQLKPSILLAFESHS